MLPQSAIGRVGLSRFDGPVDLSNGLRGTDRRNSRGQVMDRKVHVSANLRRRGGLIEELERLLEV